MFTGLIEALGTVSGLTRQNNSLILRIKPQTKSFVVPIGGSVSVNGSCLTVTHATDKELTFTAVSETVQLTTIQYLTNGDKVNLERALQLTGRLDGHLVAGHVDGIGTILSDKTDGSQTLRTISIDSSLAPFCAKKGSICVDGISLTITDSGSDYFSVAIIPHSLSATTLSLKQVREKVNIECDLVARYIFHLIKSGAVSQKEATSDSQLLTKLKENGF